MLKVCFHLVQCSSTSSSSLLLPSRAFFTPLDASADHKEPRNFQEEACGGRGLSWISHHIKGAFSKDIHGVYGLRNVFDPMYLNFRIPM